MGVILTAFQAAFEVGTLNTKMHADAIPNSQILLISMMVRFHLLTASRATSLMVFTHLLYG